MQTIEALAERFLAGVPHYIWDGETLPVPIEEIADSHVGLLVRDVEDLSTAPGAPLLSRGQTLSGLLLPAFGEIWVSAGEAREWPRRRRFTIAHELGHWKLHRDTERGVYCRAGSIEQTNDNGRPPPPLPEEQANAFAAAVLMPAQLVEQQYTLCRGDFERIRETFHASGAAMSRRLHQVISAGTDRPDMLGAGDQGARGR
jgi:hypothetical protein